jgi:glycosyltransferase involved in cell wall biosynthesis
MGPGMGGAGELNHMLAEKNSIDTERAELVGSHANGEKVFLTIAIPQYRRRQYLEANLETLFQQTYQNFEIVVSDDNSGDDSNEVIPAVLSASGRPFRYYAQRENLGYDKNVRFCLANARGEYAMLLGNDDAITEANTLEKIANELNRLGKPAVVITNYEDWESHQLTRRTYGTHIFGRGPETALHYFRSFSFVSGLIYKTSELRKHETDKWDQSIYYQMYLACRIIAAGEAMAGLDLSAIRDHIRLGGELVPETYRRRYKDAGWTFRPKHTGLDSVARVVFDAVAPYVNPAKQSAATTKIWQQLFSITYPYWVLEYRRLANWSWGLAIARDLWPGHRLREYHLSPFDRIRLWFLYLVVTGAALIIPPSLFTAIRHKLAELIRLRRQK